MRIIVCNDYEEMSKQAAKLVASQINLKPNCVLGLATGSTPVGMYRDLVQMNQNGEIDFSEVTTFNLDEYYPLSASNSQSYHYFMQEQLFSKVNIMPEHTHIPNGETKNPEEECARYEDMIQKQGGVDLQILGIGQNGHIGFNEPDMNLNSVTHLTDLTENTIEANSRFFESKDDVPKQALTMGVGTILKSKKIVLLASGRAKHRVVAELLNSEINTNIPATMLKVHPDVVLICDKEAYASMYLGIDIGGSAIKLGVIDEENNLIYKDSIPTKIGKSGEIIMDDIARACKKLIKKYPVAAAGVGTPGVIHEDKTVSAANLPFDHLAIGAILTKKLGIPVSVDNDANCAAYGEATVGTKSKNMLMITLGTGIGGGIIIDGKIYSGMRGDAGEIGHMCIIPDGLPCPCGSHGCWERYASVSALIEQAHEAAKKHPDSILAKEIAEHHEMVDGKIFFSAIEQGCDVAKSVFNTYLGYLAIGIRNLITVFRPESVVLAGGITLQGNTLLEPLKEKLKTDIPVMISKLQSDAGVMGAALLAGKR